MGFDAVVGFVVGRVVDVDGGVELAFEGVSFGTDGWLVEGEPVDSGDRLGGGSGHGVVDRVLDDAREGDLLNGRVVVGLFDLLGPGDFGAEVEAAAEQA